MKHSHYYLILLLFTPFGITDTFGCSPNSDGLYGETGAFDTVVSFAYEIDVPTNQVNNVTTDVIPALEIFFSTWFLMDLFPATCSTLEASSIQEIVGLSTLGMDTVRDGTTCEAIISGATCLVIDGEVTLYFSEQSALDWSSIVLAHLKKHMNNGKFIGTEVKRVAMYNNGVRTDSPSASPLPKAPTTWLEDTMRPLVEAMEGNSIIYDLVIFGPLILVFVFVCCSCRGMCRKDEIPEDEKKQSKVDRDEENSSDPDSDDDDQSKADVFKDDHSADEDD